MCASRPTSPPLKHEFALPPVGAPRRVGRAVFTRPQEDRGARTRPGGLFANHAARRRSIERVSR